MSTPYSVSSLSSSVSNCFALSYAEFLSLSCSSLLVYGFGLSSGKDRARALFIVRSA